MNRTSVVLGMAAVAILSVAASAQQQTPPRGGGMGSRGTEIKPGESCPPGTTEIRPQRCMGPETPAPSILDYRPKSTLIAPVHPVPKAKYPAIDYHGHPGALLSSPEGLASLAASLDSLNVRVMIAANNASGEQLTRTLAAISASPMKDRVRVLTGVDLRNVGPGWAEKAVAQLEADAKAGAVGIGEIGKGFGLSTKKADGSRLKLDDPDLKPVWDAAARLRLPVFIHTADPPQFFEPIDYTNERWLELSLFPERRFPPDRFPKFEELMTERDNLFRNNPKTTFVMAHMGWHANDLGRLGRMLDAMPNVHTEVGAVM